MGTERKVMEFQYNPLNRRFTVEKEKCSSSKVPFIIDRLGPNLGMLWSMGLSDKCGVSGRDESEKVVHSPSEVPFIFHRSKPNLQVL